MLALLYGNREEILFAVSEYSTRRDSDDTNIDVHCREIGSRLGLSLFYWTSMEHALLFWEREPKTGSPSFLTCDSDLTMMLLNPDSTNVKPKSKTVILASSRKKMRNPIKTIPDPLLLLWSEHWSMIVNPENNPIFLLYQSYGNLFFFWGILEGITEIIGHHLMNMKGIDKEKDRF